MKKEKYITLVTRSSGNKYYRIQIKAYDQTFNKNIAINEFQTAKEALIFAKKIRDEQLVKMQNGYTVSGFKTVKDIYEQSYDLIPVRMKTRERHDHFFKYAMSAYGSKTIDKITSADIQKSINDYAKDHTHIQTEHLLAVWRRLYKSAVMMNMNIPNRTIPVRIPECKRENPRKKDIYSDDLEIFCDTLLHYNEASEVGNYQSTCLYYAIQIMRYCGLRPAETLPLTKDDIHLMIGSGSYISIDKASHSTADSMLEVGATKTRQSIRNVPIPDQLKPILIDCLKWTKHDMIFADYFGNLQDIDKVSDYVHRVAKKANVKFNLYMLRHQLSTDLFTTGVPANIIRDIMGHESASMSLDYAVSSEKDRAEAMNVRRFN